jgi:hypothetical protein
MSSSDEREHDLQLLLRRHADAVDVPGDFAPGAIARRRRERRNRVVLATAAAIVAVGVLAPLLWSRFATGPAPLPATSTSTGTSGQPSPSGSATTGTAPPTSAPATPSAVPTVDSDAKPVATGTFAIGAVSGSPGVAYAIVDLFHDGPATVRLPVSGAIQYLARLAGGRVLVHAPTTGGAPTTVVGLSAADTVTIDDVQSLVARADGVLFATVDHTGTISVRDASGTPRANLRTGDANATVTGWYGDEVYYTLLNSDTTLRTRSWNPSTGTTRAAADGRLQAIDETRGLALLYPNQKYTPTNTCYAILDLTTGRSRFRSCGEFEPSHFAAAGTLVVGPTVADGPGARAFKVASTEDGRVLLAVHGRGSLWAPSWRGGDGEADPLVLTALDADSPTRQTIITCALDGTCTTRLTPEPITTDQRDRLHWPVNLSAN